MQSKNNAGIAKMNIQIAGENAFIIYFGDLATPEIAQKIKSAEQSLRHELKHLLIDLIPSYASLLVLFNIDLTDHYIVINKIKACLSALVDGRLKKGKTIELPVYYGTEVGIDLITLTKQTNLSVDEIIQIHQLKEYRVYAIGFAPGFAYLGDVDERISSPRLATPRKKVPQGAVAIADKQTAIYPSESPGGWNIIGRSPQRMFDVNKVPSMPVSVGDIVRFVGINKPEYLALGGLL
jgi:KipI family sensor histidine kinase inhibitor